MGVEAEVEKKGHRRGSQEITALIEEYRRSGQTRREFCQSHGLAPSSFQSSIRRRRQRSGKTGRDAIREVQIVGSALEMRRCGLAVISRNWYEIRVERDFDSRVLRRLLAALESWRCLALVQRHAFTWRSDPPICAIRHAARRVKR